MSLKKPIIQISNTALEQLSLIVSNDYTVKDQVFRLIIDSKGCEGFRYSVGFAAPHGDDIILKCTHNNQLISIALDPFSAYYMQIVELDYIQDFENNKEGFTITNLNEKKHHGKFWKKDSTLIPTHIQPSEQGL